MENIGAVLVVDDVEFSTDPFVVQNYVERQYYFADLNTSFDIASVIDEKGSGLFTVADNITASRITVTALKDIWITLGGEVRDTGAGARAFVAVRDGSGVKVCTGDMNGTTNPSDSIFPKIYLASGQSADVEYFNNGTLAEARFVATAEADSPALVTPAKTANVSSASSTDSITTIANSTDTFLDFEDIDSDVDGRIKGAGSGHVTATKTGFYWEADRSGTVKVSSHIMTANAAVWTAGEWARLEVYKNGTTYRTLGYFEMAGSPGSAFVVRLGGSTTIDVAPGDYLEIMLRQTSGGALALDGNGGHNYVDFHFTGSTNFLAAIPQTEYQIKQATGGNLRNGLTGYIDTDDLNFRFDNLVIGRTYRISAQFDVQDNTFAPARFRAEIDVENGATVVATTGYDDELANQSNLRNRVNIMPTVFVATATSIRFNVTQNINAIINSAKTFTMIEELPLHKETTRFS